MAALRCRCSRFKRKKKGRKRGAGIPSIIKKIPGLITKGMTAVQDYERGKLMRMSKSGKGKAISFNRANFDRKNLSNYGDTGQDIVAPLNVIVNPRVGIRHGRK